MHVGGTKNEDAGIVRENGYRLAYRVTYACGAVRLQPITFHPEVRRYGTDIEIWQSLLKKTRKRYPQELS
jgi:hypothetical protein